MIPLTLGQVLKGDSIIWKGAYNPSTMYTPLQAVEYQGSSYICIKSCKGFSVTDTAYWNLMAKRGADGSGTGFGSSAVSSVNGEVGDVTLTAGDVQAATTAQGAKADTAIQPLDLQQGLDTKVDKVANKKLSTEDYTTAEKTKLASLSTSTSFDPNKAGIFLASTYGVVGGVGVDESANINAALDACGSAGGGVVIVRATPATAPIYIAKAVSVEYSNVTLKIESPISQANLGLTRINGSLFEYTRGDQTSKPSLASNSTTDAQGRMVLSLKTGQGANFVVGDQITIRGLQDSTGKTLEKQTTYIASISGDVLTTTDEPDYTFKAVYPNSDYAPDRISGTQVTVVLSSKLTSDVSNTYAIPVVDGTIFTKGDLVMISDSRTEGDIDGVTGFKNAANMEIYRIAGVSGNTVNLEAAVRRTYLTSYNACISKIDAVKDSHIIVDSVSWVEVQTNRNPAFQTNYADNCSIVIRSMNGYAGRLGQGARLSYSYNCEIRDSSIVGAYSYGSGEGYGATIYYSTNCRIKNCRVSACRHNYLLQTATSCDVFDCESTDDYISGIDLHGAGCVGCRIKRNRVKRSNNYSPSVTNGGAIRNGNTSHVIGDHDTVIEDNYIEGYNSSLCSAIDVSPSSRFPKIQRNTIIDCNVGVRLYRNSSTITPTQVTDVMLVEDNDFIRCTQPTDIVGASNGALTELIFNRNKSFQNSAHFTATKVTKVTARGNEAYQPITSAGVALLTFTTITDLFVSGNFAKGVARGVSITSCPNAKIMNNLFDYVTDVAVFDGGGNTGYVNYNNLMVTTSAATGTVVNVYRGTLAANTSVSAAIANNNSTPVATDGTSFISATETATGGQKIEVEVVLPYVSLTGASGPATAHLFANGVAIASLTKRLTTGGSSGDGFLLVGMIDSATAGNLSLDARIGPDVNTNSLLLNSKFNGLSQPYMIVKKY